MDRKEQIEQARRLIATGISEDLVAVLHQQFPELKESEDERIRKWLIEEIKATHDYDSPTSRKCVDDALAYLERMKEQKPANATQTDANKNANAEWREEEEIKINFLKNLINYQVGDGDYCFGHNGKDSVSKQEAIKMLLSLRHPHRKPSEYTLSIVKKVADGEMLTGVEQMAMGTLYNDLKKL